MKQAKISAGVVVNKRGKILIVSNRGISWSLPKGHVDPGENGLEAAEREIFEESGIKHLNFIKELGEYQRVGNKSHELKNIKVYLFTTDQEELSPQDPLNPEARWVDRNEVQNYLNYKEDGEFFEKIHDQILENN